MPYRMEFAREKLSLLVSFHDADFYRATVTAVASPKFLDRQPSCAIYPTAVSTSYRRFSKSILNPLEWFQRSEHAFPASTSSIFHNSVYGIHKLHLERFLWAFKLPSNWGNDFLFVSSNFPFSLFLTMFT